MKLYTCVIEWGVEAIWIPNIVSTYILCDRKQAYVHQTGFRMSKFSYFRKLRFCHCCFCFITLLHNIWVFKSVYIQHGVIKIFTP
jgi:hypothetical protein